MQSDQQALRLLTLPIDISEDFPQLSELRKSASGIVLFIPDDYVRRAVQMESLGEVFAIQRLLSIVRLDVPISVKWGETISRQILEIVRLQPLLAVTVMLQECRHELLGVDNEKSEQLLAQARQGIQKHRLIRDFFTPSQLLLCADSRGYGRPEQLYLPQGGSLRPRSHFETLVQDVLATELKATESPRVPRRPVGLS